jgi:hypothetical protein
VKVPSFDMSADDEAALGLARSYLEGVTEGGIRLTTVAVVRWCIHRAAAGVAAAMTEGQQESERDETDQ